MVGPLLYDLDRKVVTAFYWQMFGDSRPNFTSDVHLVFTSMIGWMFTSESVWEMTTGRDDLSFSR